MYNYLDIRQFNRQAIFNIFDNKLNKQYLIYLIAN